VFDGGGGAVGAETSRPAAAATQSGDHRLEPPLPRTPHFVLLHSPYLPDGAVARPYLRLLRSRFGAFRRVRFGERQKPHDAAAAALFTPQTELAYSL